MKNNRTSAIIDATLSEIAFVLVMAFLIGFTLQIWEQRKSANYDDPGKAASNLPFTPDLSKLPVDLYDDLKDRAERIMGLKQYEQCKLRVSNWTVQVLDGAIYGDVPPKCVGGRLVYEVHQHVNVLFPIGSAQLTSIGTRCINASCEQIYAAWLQNKASIEAVHIKGHSSTDWKDPRSECRISGVTEINSFACNMQLSVQRATAAWLQCLAHLSSTVKSFDKVEFSNIFMPIGRSSIDTIRTHDGCESPIMSRRVEFEMVARPR